MAFQLNQMSLRQQVYHVLREYLISGEMNRGDAINLDKIAQRLRISRTPLREALLRLEVEGFVSIRPRSGIVVRTLTEVDIRNLYEMIGALESTVLRNVSHKLTPELIATMRQHNDGMRASLKVNIFDRYYPANVALHNIFMDLSDNVDLRHQVDIMKLRLYEFSYGRVMILDWEYSSVEEHEKFITRLEKGDFDGAADYLRDVHWSFDVQAEFIRQYYAELGVDGS